MVKIDMVKHQLSFLTSWPTHVEKPWRPWRLSTSVSLSPSAPLYSTDGREDARLMGFVAAVHNLETNY